MDAGKIDVNITFDDNNQIRVLSAEKYRETENLKGECIDFLKSKLFILILNLNLPFLFYRNYVL